MYQLRYAAFMAAHGSQPNYEFMDFIQVMLGLYAEAKGGSYSPLNPYPLDSNAHDEFDLFIKNNAEQYEVCR